MTLEFLEKKEKLRKLIDDYAVLGDDKKITEQMELFTPNITYKAFMGGIVVSEVSGKTNMEKEFIGHASLVKTYFTLMDSMKYKLTMIQLLAYHLPK